MVDFDGFIPMFVPGSYGSATRLNGLFALMFLRKIFEEKAWSAELGGHRLGLFLVSSSDWAQETDHLHFWLVGESLGTATYPLVNKHKP